ncbi:MAG TPA: hypothetical protein VGS08_03290 [Candidatus Saccharimonadales bacterium]|nr:hypothetical protein [Candidatus Saccharimonadales bacterium]
MTEILPNPIQMNEGAPRYGVVTNPELVHNILNSQEAQQIFAQGGEQAYTDYVHDQLIKGKEVELRQPGVVAVRKNQGVPEVSGNVGESQKLSDNPDSSPMTIQDHMAGIENNLGNMRQSVNNLRDLENSLDASSARLAKSGEPEPQDEGKQVRDEKDGQGPVQEDWSSLSEDEKAAIQEEALQMHEKWQAARNPLIAAMDRYALLSANQRGSHYGRLEASGPFRRFESFVRNNSWLHPFRVRRSRREDAAREEARLEFLHQLRDFTPTHIQIAGEYERDSAGMRSRMKALTVRLAAMDMVEGRIEQWQGVLTEAKYRGVMTDMYGVEHDVLTPTNNRINALGNRIARDWQRASKVGRIFRVALPAAAIGVGGGALALLTAPWLAPAALGVATAYVGKKSGHGQARAASRRMILTDQGLRQARERAGERRGDFESVHLAPNAVEYYSRNPYNLDITGPIESGTRRDIGVNYDRRRKAGTVGAAAAAAAFGGMQALRAVGAAGHNGGAHPGHPGSGPGRSVNPNVTPPNPGVPSADLHEFPWTVAEHLTQDPGKALPTVRQAIMAWNQVHPAAQHLRLGAWNGTRVIFEPHGAIVDTKQMVDFNRFMSDWYALTH